MRRSFFLLAMSSVLVLLFQNCSAPEMRFLASEKSGSASNNGEPYGGKPINGDYYRHVPGYTCNGQNKIFQTLSVGSSTATLHSVKATDCSDISQTISLGDVKSRNYNNDIIGYADGAFEKSVTPASPTSPQARLLETWCRTSDLGTNTSDIVIHQEVATGLLSAKVYSVSGTTAEAGISKVMGSGKLDYKSAAINLSIDMSAGRGNTSGQLVFQNNGISTSTNVTCTTAGWIDAAVPAAPTFALNFSSPVLPSSVSFSRASTATYINASGNIATQAANQPRFEYLSGVLKGLLLESSSTNLILQSEQINNAAYVPTDCTVLANQTTAPDGTNTADALIENAANNIEPSIFQHVAGLDQTATYTCSAFLKPNGRNHAVLKLNGNSPANYCEIHAYMESGDHEVVNIGAASHCRAFLQPLANGWFRAAISGQPQTAAGTGNIDCVVFATGEAPSGTDALPYNGEGNKGIFIWGNQ
jgi:hypothetical protein